MNSYKFSLEKVLEWRVDNEEIIAKGFAKLQNKLNNQEIVLSNLRSEDENIKKKILTVNNIYGLKQQYRFKQRVEENIEEQEVLIDKTRLEIEELRLDLLEAQKNRKIMEKLKENDYSTYKKNIMFIEQKELDEVGVLSGQRVRSLVH